MCCLVWNNRGGAGALIYKDSQEITDIESFEISKSSKDNDKVRSPGLFGTSKVFTI